LPCLGRTYDRIHPVPGLSGEDGVECATGRVPALEWRDLDLETVLAGEVSHPLVGFDAQHFATGRLELPGCDSSAATDVEDMGSGTGRYDPLRQRIRVAGTGPVIEFGIRPERLRYPTCLMNRTRL
jgi:hypothetical protein